MTIILNTRSVHSLSVGAITRNEAKYLNPEGFRPERFLGANGEFSDSIVSYAFSGGRRICTGRHVANAPLWSAIVSILAVFRNTPCKDEQGNDVPVNPEWTVGIISCVNFIRLLVSSHIVFTPFLFIPGILSVSCANLCHGPTAV